MSTNSKKKRLAAMSPSKTQYQLRERRSKFYVYGTGLVLSLTLIGSVTVFTLNEKAAERSIASAAKKPITGVQTFTDLARTHNSTPIAFSQRPPSGGDHSPSWMSCGVYTSPVDTLRAVHSLEHGAVWVTYQPALPPQQIKVLSKAVISNPYQLLSPYAGLSSPIVLSAWGKQLELQDAADPRLPIFLKAYTQGAQTPEPGATC